MSFYKRLKYKLEITNGSKISKMSVDFGTNRYRYSDKLQPLTPGKKLYLTLK